MFTSIGNRRHNSSRCSKYQCTRTEHNENRHSADHFTGYKICTNGCKKGHHYNPGSPAICKAYNFGIAWIRFLYELNHTLNGAIFPSLCSHHVECTELVDCTRKYIITYMFVYRHRFSSHNRLIHRCSTHANCTIHRNDFTRQHANHITNCNHISRNAMFCIVTDNTRRCRR